jgi:hypothetical protein
MKSCISANHPIRQIISPAREQGVTCHPQGLLAENEIQQPAPFFHAKATRISEILYKAGSSSMSRNAEDRDKEARSCFSCGRG